MTICLNNRLLVKPLSFAFASNFLTMSVFTLTVSTFPFCVSIHFPYIFASNFSFAVNLFSYDSELVLFLFARSIGS